MKFLWVKFLIILALAAGLYMVIQLTKPKPQSTVVYLVRHAEKITGDNAGRDPQLSPAGKARAKTLAAMLANKHINKIFSSDYARTRGTAAPLAKELGLDIQIYDPRDLPALATLIKSKPETYLVVGHSNTIPQTVLALSGDDSPPIEEASEYDRLYIVKIDKNGHVQSQLQRYGKRYKSASE